MNKFCRIEDPRQIFNHIRLVVSTRFSIFKFMTFIIFIFRSICNIQDKLFIQCGRFSFFFRPKLPTLLIQKLMTAVGLGQQGSQAVGSGFESLPCQIFLRFIPNISTRKK